MRGRARRALPVNVVDAADGIFMARVSPSTWERESAYLRRHTSRRRRALIAVNPYLMYPAMVIVWVTWVWDSCSAADTEAPPVTAASRFCVTCVPMD